METNPWYHASDVQLFSGCEDSGTSADVSSRYGRAEGAMSTAFCEVLRRHRNPPYTEFIESLLRKMREKGFKQKPQLSSSQQFDFRRTFDLTDPIKNSNPYIGRVVNQRFKPNPRPMGSGDPLAELLSDLGLKPEMAGMIKAGITAVAGMLMGKKKKDIDDI